MESRLLIGQWGNLWIHYVSQVEVKVVDGNDVIHLYEKYGFKINAHWALAVRHTQTLQCLICFKKRLRKKPV